MSLSKSLPLDSVILQEVHGAEKVDVKNEITKAVTSYTTQKDHIGVIFEGSRKSYQENVY